MIHVTFKDQNDHQVTQAYMHCPPHKDELIWLLPADNRQSAYKVTEVAHWVSDVAPEGYHNCCVYVEKI